MPRRKEDDDNGGETRHAGGGETDAAKQLKARQEQEKNVVVGEEKTLEQQIKEARGEEEGGDKDKAMRDYSDGADKEAEKALEEAFPERKAIDLRVEARRKFNEKFGIDPNKPDDRFKVEISDKVKDKKLYKGRLTLQSVHGETHERLAFVTNEDVARGEDYLWYVMKRAHPHAIREFFEVDPENKTEPQYRSRYE